MACRSALRSLDNERVRTYCGWRSRNPFGGPRLLSRRLAGMEELVKKRRQTWLG